MTESLGIQSRPPQLAELEEGQSVTVLAQPKTLGGGAPLVSQYREYLRVGGNLLSWEAKDMLAEVDWSTTLPDSLAITNIPAGASDYDKFLVSDGGMIKYRTGAQMLSDLGVATADHTHALPDLTDVVITGPADLDVLQYDGGSSRWVDRGLAEAGISATGHLHDDRYYTETEIDAMPLVDYSGTPANNQIPTFTDVDTIQGESALTFDGSSLSASPDTNTSHTFGRSVIGYGVHTDFAWFSHVDRVSAGDYALIQNAAGTTYLNCSTGQTISLRVNNTGLIFMDSVGNLGVGSAVSSPLHKLHVSGIIAARSVPTYGYIALNPGSVAQAGYLEIYKSGPTRIGYIGYDNTNVAWTLEAGADLQIMGGNVGIGTDAPDSIFHIKANTPGTVGSHPAGQLIIQDPDDTVFGNVVITAYESDGAGNPDQQLWYLGSSSSSNTDITFLNRRNANLHLGTNGVSRLTISGSGNVGIGTTTVPYLWTLKNEGQMGDVSFSSGWAGNDWALTYAAGLATLQIDDLFVRGSLTVYELIINQINAVNGAMIISPARGKVASVSGSPSTEVVTMEDPEGNGYTTFAANDIVLIQRVDLNAAYTIVKRIVRKVASAAGAAVTMSAAAGAPADTGSIAAGDVVVVIGNVNTTTRDASIYMTSTDSNNPYIQVMDGVTSWADWTDVNKIKCVLGNLNGKYGYVAEIYGFAAGDKTNEYVTIDPTNGFRILDGGQGDAVMLQASASQLSVGTGFVYTTADTTLKVAGWVTTTTSMMHNYDTDHELRLRLDSPNESIYFWDLTPANNAVRWLGLGKLHNGTDFTSDEGIGMVVYNGATYDKMFWLSQNEKSIAGWQITKDTLEKLTANVGVKLDATNTKIQVGDLDEQHIDLLGADGSVLWYRSDGAGGSVLALTIDDSVFGTSPGIKIEKGLYDNYIMDQGTNSTYNTQKRVELINGPVSGDIRLWYDASITYSEISWDGTNTKAVFVNLPSGTGTDLVDSAGRVLKKSSSRRYKKNIRPLEIDSSIIYKVPPSTFEWRVNNLTDHGLIAEDLSDLHRDLAFHNSEGKAESVNQGALMALTIAELKKLRTDVDKLIAVQEAN